MQGHTRGTGQPAIPVSEGEVHQRGLDVWPCPPTFSHVLRVGYSGKPCLRFRLFTEGSFVAHPTRPDENVAPRRDQRGATQCTVPADTRAAAPIEDNRRRTMGSFTTSIVGKLFTTGPSSLVEASAHHRYRQSSGASAHLRWLVGKHTLETSG